MAIQYQKRKGLTPEQQTEGISIIQSSRAYKLPEFGFYELLSMANPKVKRSDAIAVVEALREVIITQCTNGVTVRLPELFDIVPFVRGTQDAKGDWINGPITGLRLRVLEELSTIFQRQVVLEPIDTQTIIPIINAVEDSRTGSVNEKLSRGGSIAINGRHLKFHPLAEDEGAFFIKEDGTEVKALRGLDNTATRLTVEVPAEIEEGSRCMLVVRMRMNRNKALRCSAYETEFKII